LESRFGNDEKVDVPSNFENVKLPYEFSRKEIGMHKRNLAWAAGLDLFFNVLANGAENSRNVVFLKLSLLFDSFGHKFSQEMCQVLFQHVLDVFSKNGFSDLHDSRMDVLNFVTHGKISDNEDWILRLPLLSLLAQIAGISTILGAHSLSILFLTTIKDLMFDVGESYIISD
jgi:hypothetical protein